MNFAAPTKSSGRSTNVFSLIRLACASLCLAVLTFAAPQQLLAQGNPNGTLTGVVSDPSGGVLPGVTVVIKNAQTGLTQQTLTGTAGEWRVPALPPGQYVL